MAGEPHGPSDSRLPPGSQPGQPDDPERARVGLCAILGLPNVGKSTLLNRVLGLRLAAVSPRPQTTRNRILGVKNLSASEILAGDPAAGEAAEGGQIVFIDTPGIQHGRTALRQYMREQALAAAGDCDVGLLLVDVMVPNQRQPAELESRIGAALGAARGPIILALNKIDRLNAKDELLPIIAAYGGTERYAAIVPISARTGDGVDQLIAEIARRLPLGPRLFPEEMYTDRAERFLAGELIREQLFLQLGEELPYATAVVVEEFDDRGDDVAIGAIVWVEKDSQKGIVVGAGGQRIKQIGQRARASIGRLLGCPVHLRLLVKVSRNWSRGKRSIRDMGYE